LAGLSRKWAARSLGLIGRPAICSQAQSVVVAAFKTALIEFGQWGLTVTICIATVALPGPYIVTVSDRMLSDVYDRVQGRDNATLKNIRVSPKWRIMFSGNSELWPPFYTELLGVLPDDENTHDVDTIETSALDTYNVIRRRHITSQYLTAIGYNNFEEFMQNGLSQLGPDIFSRYIAHIENFDFQLDLIICGFEGIVPYIFTVEPPGILKDRGVEGIAVIGSGSLMARAVLHRKNNFTDLQSTIYRLLDAKFSAETAAGVGRSTSIITLRADGHVGMMTPPQIDAVRKIWNEAVSAPDPKEAIDLINGSLSAGHG
jgi:hypothetical protein